MPTGGLFNWADSLTNTQTWTTVPETWSTISYSAYIPFNFHLQQTSNAITWNATDINLSAFEDWTNWLDTSSPAKDAGEPTEEEFFELLE